MSPEPRDLRELLGDDVAPAELERLRRVHALLVSAGPPPELSPALQSAPPVGPRGLSGGGFSWFGRPRIAAAVALAAGIAAAAFGIGFLAGHVSDGGFNVQHTILMRGTADAPNAAASIDVGNRDASGNVPMIVRVGGLPKLEGRAYYELYLTKNRRPILTCGTFNGGDRVTLRFSVPYSLDTKRYDGWVVTRERAKTPHPGPTVLTTFA